MMAPDRTLTPSELGPLTEAIATAMSKDVLRMKALLPLAGGGHLVLQASLGRLFPPEHRDQKLHGPGRAVIITEGVEPAALLQALTRFGLRPT